MQQAQKTQLKLRSKFSQLILLNQQAQIVSSCDSIFSTILLKDKPVIDWFPFMESIYSNIWETIAEQSNMYFNKMETPIPELPGIYDFSFSKIKVDEEDLLLWSVYDYTDLYEDFKQFQQRKNELEIHRETLEHRYQNLKNKEDIKIQQNIIIESLDHLQLTYFNKLKSALLAPVNALDGISHLLTETLENKSHPYTQQLRITLKQLNLILSELENIGDSDNLGFPNQSFDLSTLQKDIIFLVQQKHKDAKLSFIIDEAIQDPLRGNFIYLKQTLWGILGNAIGLHPNSSFNIKICPATSKNEKRILRFQITEFLNEKTDLLSEQDYTNMVYRLSIVKQLIDLQKGNLSVDKNPKELSITISFELEFYH